MANDTGDIKHVADSTTRGRRLLQVFISCIASLVILAITHLALNHIIPPESYPRASVGSSQDKQCRALVQDTSGQKAESVSLFISVISRRNPVFEPFLWE